LPAPSSSTATIANRPSALAGAVATLRSGLAVAIAPEGTRSRGSALGSFKKGGFRLAMAAGVPIVPIAIHDAWRVLPRDTPG
jgi:putative phosphoserine phosphatase/1-acylglycerol-3-phosphate O-acyltransferase